MQSRERLSNIFLKLLEMVMRLLKASLDGSMTLGKVKRHKLDFTIATHSEKYELTNAATSISITYLPTRSY